MKARWADSSGLRPRY